MARYAANFWGWHTGLGREDDLTEDILDLLSSRTIDVLSRHRSNGTLETFISGSLFSTYFQWKDYLPFVTQRRTLSTPFAACLIE